MGWYRLLKLTSLLLSLATYSFAQAPIGSDDICQRVQSIPDNLSCPRADGALQCYPRTQLCNGVNFCDDGSDEGVSLNALDCDGDFTGRTTNPIPAFVCQAGVIVELDQLCDGNDDCGGGDDETTALCENKCLTPYYGSCPFTRECVSTDLDVNCGNCLAGFARNPADIFGDCLPATFTFNLATFSVVENAGPLTGSVRLDTTGQIDRQILVVVQTVATGTATVGSDYSAIVSTLTFTRFSGSNTMVQFTVPITDDLLVEDTENFGLSASIVNGLGVFSPGGDSATGQIIDNDGLIVGYEPSVYNVIEGDTQVEVCLVPTNAVQLQANGNIAVATANIGQAVAGLDYDATSTTVTFGPGSVRECWQIMIREDTLDENEECFQVNAVSQASFISIDPMFATAMVCIQDDDVLDFEFSQTVYNVGEGDPSVEVCIDLIAGVLQRNVPIMLSTADGSATSVAPIDYTSTTQTVTFATGTMPNGAGAQQCINIPINDDILVENLETFSVGASSTDAEAMFPNGNTAAVQIMDNDIPLFEFTQTSYSVNENMGPAQAAIELVSRELTFNIVVTVVDMAGGSATDGVDYTGVTALLTFSAGDGVGTQRSFTFPIINDNIVEDTETVNLQATAAAPGDFTPGGDQATVAILDDDRCEVGFELLDYTVAEADILQEVCLVKLNAAQLQESINVQVSTINLGGTVDKDPATANSDYDTLPAGTTVTFGPGVTRDCVMIQINEDTVDERNERFGLIASSSNSQLAITRSSATVCITDDDVVMFRFSLAQYNVNEGDGTAEVCIVLTSGSAPRQITIDLDTSDLQATSPADFTSGGYSVVFAPNAAINSEQCVNIPINDDSLVEFTENFQVMASSSDSQATFPVGGNSAIVMIEDNDVPMFRFTSQSYFVNENMGPATVTVELFQNELTFPIAVNVIDVVGGGSASDGLDYIGVSETLSFPAGSQPGTQMSFDITIVDDNTDEPQEDIELEGSVVAPGPGAFTNNPARVFINDDDVCIVGIELDTYTVIENAGTVEVCLTKRNNVDLSGPVDVQVSTGPAPSAAGKDAAQAGIDYTPLSSVSVTFSPGVTRMCTEISITNDMLAEGTENFLVTASSNNQASIDIQAGDESAEVCIQDDDLSEFAFSQSVYTTEEGQPIVQACIELVDGTLTRSLPVDVISVAGGTATVNSDYTPISVTLNFPPGSTPGVQQCFDLPINDDFITENTEFYSLSASSTDSQVTFRPGGDSARVDIIDNDRVPIRIVPPPGLGVPNFEIPENGGPLEVCVEINDPFNQDHLEKSVTVTLSSADTGSAQAGADYGPINQLITFTPANQNNQMCVNIPITNDIICEDDETFSIQLSSSDDCVDLQMPSQGTVTIIDDDVASVGPENGIINYNVTERLDDAVWIPIRLTGQKGPGRQCEVEVRTMDGTASAGMDYTSLTTTLTFDNSNELQTVHIDILDDTICEGHETFTVALNTMSDGCQISDSLLTVWIWDDEVHFGDDPHFSIALPGGKLLCYTVQGEHGFSFNLINNDRLVMNSKFVPDARRSEVTWLGSMGIIVQDSKYKGSNSTKLRFEALEKKVYIGDKIALQAKNIERLTFSNGKLTISEAPPATSFRYPSVMVDLQDVEISFTIKFTNQHLDMYWHSTGKKITDSHGLIGQFFRDGVEIDEVRKILIMPNKEPVPVMRRPVWAFMEREEKDDQLCWTAMNPGYQGEGLIDGAYFDYLVDDVMSTSFKFNKH